MKDIDFDELDKAVSSVLSGGLSPAVPVDGNVSPAESNSANALPQAETALETPTVTSDDSSSVKSPNLARRSGRFMDVVHPSSDMTGAGGARKPEPQREANPIPSAERTITPLSNNIVPEDPTPAQEAAKADLPIPEKLPPMTKLDTTKLVSDADTDEVKWPDPLEFDSSTPAYSGTREPDSDTSLLADNLSEGTGATQSEPVESKLNAPKSPFLSDAKVDKRPLGAYSDQPPSQQADAPSAVTDMPASSPDTTSQTAELQSDMQLPAKVEKEPTPQELPPELSSDLVALESLDPEEVAPSAALTSTPSTPSVPAVTVSIPQQYKSSEQSSEDGEAHPVFAAEDHAPLPGASKKSSSKMWIVVVILALVVAGGLAAVWWLYLR